MGLFTQTSNDAAEISGASVVVVEVEVEAEVELTVDVTVEVARSTLCVLTDGRTPPPHAQQPAVAVTPVADGKSSIAPQSDDHPMPGRPAEVQYSIVAHQLQVSKSELSQSGISAHS